MDMHLCGRNEYIWDLSYWEVLEVRNAIDMMHLTKKLCVNLLGFLGMYGKPKYTLEAWQDLQRMKQRAAPYPAAPYPEKRDKRRHYLDPACYTLSKQEKESMFECLNSIKLLSGYSSNIKRLLNMKEKKFAHVRSYDYHVLMTQLLPVALRGIQPGNVRATIIKLCAFLNAISQKAIDTTSLLKQREDVVQSIVSLEIILPLSFFNIMVHLLVHFVKEIGILRHVFLHNIFSFERFFAILKKYVHNRARLEGSIAKGYVIEEVIEFCVDYVDELCLIRVPVARYEGRSIGKSTLEKKSINANDYASLSKTHFTVLQQSALVALYIEEHKAACTKKYPWKSET
jgi:hypothetical protein